MIYFALILICCTNKENNSYFGRMGEFRSLLKLSDLPELWCTLYDMVQCEVFSAQCVQCEVQD